MSNDDSQDIHETPSTTPSFRTELAAQLSDLIPEAIADGKVDVEKLNELLRDDAGDDRERFGLFWPGKKRALRAAQEPTTATLKPDFENSKDWDTTQNIFIEGDNLEVLKVLQRHYHGKIRMIYIDPPYNTGKDFIYPDNFTEGLQNYLEWTQQVDESGRRLSTNSETDGRYHSNWLNMMYPRLKVARNLLTDDGAIFISIDDHEVENLKKVCNEVFGEGNHVGTIANVNNPKGRSDDKYVATAHEYLLVYARRIANLAWYGFQPTEEITRRYSKTDSDGRKYREIDLRKTGENDLREDRPNLFYHFHYNQETGDFYPTRAAEAAEGYYSIFPQREDGREGNWRWGLETAKERISDLIPKFMPTRKVWGVMEKDYLEDRDFVKPTSAWTFKDVNSERGSEQFVGLGFDKRIYPKPKPVGTIERALRLSTDADSLVLDFFAGSGTTAHAAMALNAADGGKRHFIMVQLPEPTDEDSEARKSGFRTIADITRRRMELAGEKVKADSPLTTQSLDVGFRAFKLADTNFAKWSVSSDIEPDNLQRRLEGMRESADDGVTPDVLLTEILLKQGYSLTEQVGDCEVDGLPLKVLGDGLLLAYLDEHSKPTLDQLRAVLAEEPARFVILEDALQGDDELKTNLAQECKSRGVELWTA